MRAAVIVRVEVVEDRDASGSVYRRVTVTRDCAHQITWEGYAGREPHVGDRDDCFTCPWEPEPLPGRVIGHSDDSLELRSYAPGKYAWLRPAEPTHAVGSHGPWRVS